MVFDMEGPRMGSSTETKEVAISSIDDDDSGLDEIIVREEFEIELEDGMELLVSIGPEMLLPSNKGVIVDEEGKVEEEPETESETGFREGSVLKL